MRPRHASTLLLLLAGLVAGVWMYCNIASGSGWADDFPYSRLPIHAGTEDDFFNCAGPRLDSLSHLPEAFKEHYMAVNGRLANMLSFTLRLLPPLLRALLHAMAFALMLASMMRLAFGPGWKSHYLAVILAACCVWAVLPWQENLASECYYVNYVWSAALNLMFLSLLLEPSGRFPRWAICLLGAFAAMMHEGIGAAMDAGMILIACQRRNHINLPPLCIYILFSLLPLLSPGIRALAGMRAEAEYASNFFSYILGVRLIIIWAAALPAIFRLLFRHEFSSREAVIWAIIFTGIAIGILSRQGGRALWLPMTLAISLVFHYARPVVSLRLKTAMALTAALIFSIWGAWLCAWQYYASCERDTLLAALRAAGDKVIYMDLLQPDELPWPLLLTVSHVNGDQTIRANLQAEVFRDARHSMAVLPAAWRDRQLSQLPAIEGTAGAHGMPYTFLSTRPLTRALYTHSASSAGVALNPLYALPRRLFPSTMCQIVQIESVQTAPGEWVCRPMLYARSLLGFPVVRIDTVSP